MRFYYFFICLFLGTFVFGQSHTDIQSYINDFVKQNEFKHASLSIAVKRFSNGAAVASYQPHKALIPASSQKLLSTLSGVVILGADYTYKTKLAYDGTLLSDGTLKGNIYVIGSGDPSLGTKNINGIKSFDQLLKDMAQTVMSAGIKCIEGKVIADESIFNSFPISPSWQWNDLGNYYASGAWGINIHDNEYLIYFKQMPKKGQVPKLDRYGPYIPKITFQNEVETGERGSGDNAYIFGGPYDYTKRIVGTIPSGTKEFSIKGSIPDPPIFLAYHLSQRLKQNKVKSDDYTSVFDYSSKRDQRIVLKVYESPSYKSIAKVANFKSNNLFAEAILKTIGFQEFESGKGSKGILAIHKLLDQLQVDRGGLRLDDGSGLSARNRCSSLFMADFLQKIGTEIGLEETVSYLPKGGLQGTVASMFKRSSAVGKIWLKSGSMEGVLSYSGYFKSQSGIWHTFSIMLNGHTQKNRQMRKKLEECILAMYKLL